MANTTAMTIIDSGEVITLPTRMRGATQAGEETLKGEPVLVKAREERRDAPKGPRGLRSSYP